MRGMVSEEAWCEWVCVGDGLMEEGKPHSDGPSQCQLQQQRPALVDVKVSEVVKGRPQGPACLHIVHLFGKLSKQKRGGISIKTV